MKYLLPVFYMKMFYRYLKKVLSRKGKSKTFLRCLEDVLYCWVFTIDENYFHHVAFICRYETNRNLFLIHHTYFKTSVDFWSQTQKPYLQDGSEKKAWKYINHYNNSYLAAKPKKQIKILNKHFLFWIAITF